MRHQTGINLLPRSAVIAIGVYTVWNAAWFVCGRLPPSIFLFCTGLPCPTTGMSRSLLALFRGNLHEFLLYNPLTVPYLALSFVCAALICFDFIQRRRLVLPTVLQWTWAILLVLGWIAKFAIGRQYW